MNENLAGKELKKAKSHHEHLNEQDIRDIEKYCCPDTGERPLSMFLDKYEQALGEILRCLEMHGQKRWVKGPLSFLAPGAIRKLFLRDEANLGHFLDEVLAVVRSEQYMTPDLERELEQRFGKMRLELGRGSNIQESRGVENNNEIPLFLKFGDDSSGAHNIKIEVNRFLRKSEKEVQITVGNHTFVGINAALINGVKIGNHCAIGFNSRLEDVQIGDHVIVGDSVDMGPATDGQPIKIPSQVVILPGTKLMSFDPEKDLIRELGDNLPLHGVVARTPENMERLRNNNLGFLESFNQVVTTENKTFPLLNKLMNKFHAPEITQEHRGPAYLIQARYPLDVGDFLRYYRQQAAIKKTNPEYVISPYAGVMARQNISAETYFKGGTVHLSGQINLIGQNKIGENLIIRGDENGQAVIINSVLGVAVVLHATGLKTVENSQIDDKVVIHGESSITHSRVGGKSVLHNVELVQCHLGEFCSLVEVNAHAVRCGKAVTVTGHIRKNSNGEAEHHRSELRNCDLSSKVCVGYDTSLVGMIRFVVEEEVKIGNGVTIKNGQRIGRGTMIGDKTTLDRVEVGSNVKIGEGCELANVVIPNNLVILPGTKINGSGELNVYKMRLNVLQQTKAVLASAT